MTPADMDLADRFHLTEAEIEAARDVYDPWVHAKRDEPPELDDDDFCRSMFDPNEGWLDA